jgi:hypothetical protein
MLSSIQQAGPGIIQEIDNEPLRIRQCITYIDGEGENDHSTHIPKKVAEMKGAR